MAVDDNIPAALPDELERALSVGDAAFVREAIAKYGVRVLNISPTWCADSTLYGQAVVAAEDNEFVPLETLVDAGVRGDEVVDSIYGATPLHDAVRRAPEVVRRFLAAGANPDVRDNYGETPLMTAARSYRWGDWGRERSAISVKYLLEAGADASLRRGDGKTALELALEQPIVVPEVIQLLMKR
ncbi:MAG: ankyrin repeat domain-containing protein [Phycisphaerales bacterium]